MSALVAYDSSAALGVNVRAMTNANDAIVCGEVTQAVRDAKVAVGEIKEGDWLGVTGDGIAVVAASLPEALVQLVETLVGDDHEILTVLEGDGATSEATEALEEFLSQARPSVELDLHKGDQPLYPYLIGVE
jgi:dihydroxyacetone kinase-like predicted kinase